MAEPTKIRTYSGQDIDVQYDVKRCIHAEQCIHRLRAVFDNTKRPWIQPENDTADAVAQTVEACPSGALKYQRKDDQPNEVAPAENILKLAIDGPIYVSGKVHLKTGDTLVDETRVALCRCGASENKPFCDNSHLKSGFVTGDAQPSKIEELVAQTDLSVEIFTDGPMGIEGSFSIINAEGAVIFQGQSAFLCRCGHSEHKPFCDNTHRKIGFKAD